MRRVFSTNDRVRDKHHSSSKARHGTVIDRVMVAAPEWSTHAGQLEEEYVIAWDDGKESTRSGVYLMPEERAPIHLDGTPICCDKCGAAFQTSREYKSDVNPHGEYGARLYIYTHRNAKLCEQRKRQRGNKQSA